MIISNFDYVHILLMCIELYSMLFIIIDNNYLLN